MGNGIVTNWSESAPRPPYATIGIGMSCFFVFLVYASLSPAKQQVLIDTGGMIPSSVFHLLAGSVHSWFSVSALTMLISLFIHAGWLHLLGNLAYLLVFGIKVEQRFGALVMLLVFLLGGTLANLIVALRVTQIDTPIIGASGAVSAVVGAYLGLFPRRRIGLFLPLGLYLQFARVPALLVIGSWFTLQLLYTVFGPVNGAVAWWTHVAGFAVGLCFALLARALAQVRL